MSNAAVLRQHVRELYAEHLAAGTLPTSIRFWFYELVQKALIAKQASGVLKPGAAGQRRVDQNLIDAVTWLRERDEIPWDVIVDETRSLSDLTGWETVAKGVDAYLNVLELDPWAGAVPIILTESRSLAGVLRALVSEYRVMIAPTNGQAAGFLRNRVAPKMTSQTRVLYLGDWDKSGGDIEANTRRVLESIHGPLAWERLALTSAQVELYDLPIIQKLDRRDGKLHPSVETEALSQQVIVEIVRKRLDGLLPEPLKDAQAAPAESLVMGKRSTFPRVLRDAYSTPVEAVAPLLPHLEPNTRFIEPCCGDGCLVGHLERAGHICVGQCDLPTDARTWRYVSVEPGIIFITNPPWHRDVLHPIISNLSGQAPAWLLIDAGWVHTRQSEPYLPRLRTIVSVGRVKWIKDSPFTGKDDCAWHLFDLPRPDEPAVTQFIGRTDTMRRAA